MTRSGWLPDLSPDGPRVRAVADAVAADVRAGRLVPGERLPGTRALAGALGVARGTVVAAYAELEAEGWVEATEGSGTRVRADLPAAPTPIPPQVARAGGQRTRRGDLVPSGTTLGLDLPPPREPIRRLARPAGVPYALLGGQPDLRLLPLKDLARAVGRVLRRRGRKLSGYGDPGGEPRLRDALSGWLADTRGVRPVRGGLLVTRGSQMAIYLVARALLRPGDRVAVEALGYPPAWAALREGGAALIPVPVDAEGIVVDAIPDDVRMVYVTPHHQYPTGATLSATRRLRLLAWARERRVCVLEDDYDHEFHYDGAPVRPLIAADEAGVVVSVGTLSKAFAPGLRVGWVQGPPAVIDRLVALRTVVDRQGDRVTEHAVAELLEDGTLIRHLRKTRRAYAARRAALRGLLARDLPFLEVHVPAGGLAVWCHAPGVDVDAWARAALDEGAWFETHAAYAFDGTPAPWLRLGFAGYDEPELAEAVRRLAACLPRGAERGPSSGPVQRW